MSKYINSYTNVLHIDENSTTVISGDKKAAIDNLNDNSIDLSLRVIGGIWSEEIVSSKITSVLNENLIEIGESNTNVKLKGTISLLDDYSKLGIGTDNPSVSLDLSERTDALKLPKGTTINRDAIGANSENDKGLIRYNTETSQFEGFGAGNAWGSLGGVMDIDQDTYISAETNNLDNDELKFYTSNVENMIIKSDGKVGIGTSNPSGKLEIYDNGNKILNINNNNIEISRSIIPSNSNIDIGDPENQIRDIYVSDNSLWIGDTHKISHSDGKLKFRKRKTTNIPEVILQLPGYSSSTSEEILQAIATFFSDNSLLTVSNIKLRHWFKFYRNQKGSDRTISIQEIFRDDADDYEEETAADAWLVTRTNNIYLGNSYTNIGIGTDNPSVSLDLSYRTDALKLPKGTKINRDSIGANSENDKGLIRYNTETSQFEGFGAGNAWGSLGGVMDIDQDTYISAETNNLDNDELKFYTSNVEHMIIKSDGKVGIGTSNPNEKLEIYDGNLELRQSHWSNSNVSELRWTSKADEGKYCISKILATEKQNYNGELAFFTRETDNIIENEPIERMIIKSNGSIGIGTSEPEIDRKLDIIGNVKVTGNIFVYDEDGLSSKLYTKKEIDLINSNLEDARDESTYSKLELDEILNIDEINLQIRFIGTNVINDYFIKNLEKTQININKNSNKYEYINRSDKVNNGDIISLHTLNEDPNNGKIRRVAINKDNYFEIYSLHPSNNNKNLDGLTDIEYTTYNYYTKLNYKLLFRNDQEITDSISTYVKICNNQTEIEIPRNGIYDFSIIGTFDLEFGNTFCILYVRKKTDGIDSYVREFYMNPITFTETNATSTLNGSFRLYLKKDDIITFESNFKLKTGNIDVVSNQLHFSDIYNQSYLKLTERPLDYINNDIFELIKKDDSCECLNTLNLKDDTITRNKIVDNKLKTLIDLNGIKDTIPFFNNNDTFGEKILTNEIIEGSSNNIPLENAVKKYTDDKTNNIYCLNNNVGIGKENPEVLLQIGGDTLIEGNLKVLGIYCNINVINNTSEELIITNKGTGPAVVINQTGDQPIINIKDDNVTCFYIEDGGNIGIGTDNPSVSLDLSEKTDALKLPKGTTINRDAIGANNENDKGLIRYNTDLNQFEGFGAGNAWGSLGGVMDIDQDTYISAETNNLDNDELKFYTSNVEHMIIKSNGKVGIGTSNPSGKLEIYDNGNKILNINNNIEISRSIIPSNSNIDIGDPENQIRNILSDSSIWIGDTHKISKSNGKLMFRKRKQIPDSIKTLLEKSEQQIVNDIGKDINNIKLRDLITYLKNQNKNIDLNEIFGDNTNDYEEEITTDAWLLKNNNIYFGSEYNNIGIGTSTNLNDKLTVNGTIKATNLVGNLNTSNLIVKGDLINSASIKLNNKDNTENITLKVPTNLSTSSYTLTLPEDVGTENQVLSTDGTGILSFITLPSNTISSSISNNVSNLEVDEIIVKNDIRFKGNIIKLIQGVPEVIITPNVLENLINTDFKFYKFEYTDDTDGLIGQTQYILSVNKDIYCDILC